MSISCWLINCTYIITHSLVKLLCLCIQWTSIFLLLEVHLHSTCPEGKQASTVNVSPTMAPCCWSSRHRLLWSLCCAAWVACLGSQCSQCKCDLCTLGWCRTAGTLQRSPPQCHLQPSCPSFLYKWVWLDKILGLHLQFKFSFSKMFHIVNCNALTLLIKK